MDTSTLQNKFLHYLLNILINHSLRHICFIAINLPSNVQTDELIISEAEPEIFEYVYYYIITQLKFKRSYGHFLSPICYGFDQCALLMFRCLMVRIP